MSKTPIVMQLCRMPFRVLLFATAIVSLSLSNWAQEPSGTKSSGTKRRPNIVFLLSDDHQARAMGCMGNRDILTPNLDKLAAKGLLFEKCYATTAICMASRASILTGMYEYKTGCNFTTGSVSAKDWNALAYPVLLRKAGYRVGYRGKWNIPVEGIKWQAAFDEWAGFDNSGRDQGFYQTIKNTALAKYAKDYPHVSRALGAFGCDFIRNSVKENRPFCLTLGFKAPHIPYDYIDPQDEKLYQTTRFQKPGNYGREVMDKLPMQAKLSRQYLWRDHWDEEHFQDRMRLYCQLVSGLDAAIGTVIAELQRQGMADNTVILYSSDNGHFCGNHGMDDKVLAYEESSMIPLIIVDPTSPAAGRQGRCKSVVANIDFAPTILDYAGVPIPGKMDGKSLKTLVTNPGGTIHESIALATTWSWADTDHSRAMSVVTSDWKYIFWCYGDANMEPAEELFDLQHDPIEVNNLAGMSEHAAVLAQMRDLYDQHLQHWSENTVADPRYTRFRTIFDRHVPWKEKSFDHFASSPVKDLYTEMGRKEMMQLYKAQVGKEPPTASP